MATHPTLANDLTDRQWAAAYVLDNAPIAFDPLKEATATRERAAISGAEVLAPHLLTALHDLVTDLDQLTTIREQRELLTAIARGDA